MSRNYGIGKLIIDCHVSYGAKISYVWPTGHNYLSRIARATWSASGFIK
jgi:hypothetical protein